MASINAIDAPLELSTDGVTYKTLVCLTSTGTNMSRDVTRTETFCGISVSLGNLQVTVPFSAICETAPTATQVTYKEMLGWMNGGTLLYWRIYNGTSGANFFTSGTAYVTTLDQVSDAGSTVNFSGQLDMTGNLDITW
jgi:hypothetical protein